MKAIGSGIWILPDGNELPVKRELLPPGPDGSCAVASMPGANRETNGTAPTPHCPPVGPGYGQPKETNAKPDLDFNFPAVPAGHGTQ